MNRLVVLGGSGDLMSRFLFPALVTLEARGRLADLEILGAGRHDWSDDELRAHLTSGLDPADGDAQRLLERVRYRRADATVEADVRALVGDGTGPMVVYLALPPAVTPEAVRSLARVDLPAGSRLALEKPFAEDLASARQLNQQIARSFDDAKVFRVDHFLGLRAVQNLVELRCANPALAEMWNARHVARIEIVWDEELGLEGRAGYYDGVGALKDMIQNHLLVVTSMLAMEPPDSLDACDLRARRAEVLRAIRVDVASSSIRARYGAGTRAGTTVAAYTSEDGVDAERQTETFAQLTLQVDTARWRGVPFVLRTGKALARTRQEVVVTFVAPSASSLYPDAGPTRLRIGLDPEGVGLELDLGNKLRTLPVTELAGRLPADDMPAYARVLDSIFSGDAASSVGGGEVEEAWRIVEPVLEAWRQGRVPLREYPAGSGGPDERSGGTDV